MSVFADFAPRLIRSGYSPVPIRTGQKRPLFDKWDELRQQPMKAKDICRLDQNFPGLGIGVCGGHRGLVPVDVDSDDPEIRQAVRSVLPVPTVVKRGAQGATAFYYDPTGTVAGERGRKFRPPPVNGQKQKPLVEVLTTGQSVVPPTLHPDIGSPYQWRTGLALWDVPVESLAIITLAHIEALAKALEPWIPTKPIYTPQPVTAGPVSEKRMTALANHVLNKHLAGMRGIKEGRNDALFHAICTIGKFVHHGILSDATVRNALVQASVDNGYTSKPTKSVKDAVDTYESGLHLSAGDALPVLGDRD